MDNRDYAVNALEYLKQNREADNDLLEEGLARIFSNTDKKFEENLRIVQEFVYTDEANPAELFADILTATIEA